MGFLQDLRTAMDSVRDSSGYMMMDELAVKLGFRDEQGKRGGAGKSKEELLAKKIESAASMADDVGYEFPWEVVTYRERVSGGCPDMPERLIREVPLKENGEPKMNEDGTPAMQRYYVGALVWANPLKEAGKQSILELATMLAPQIGERFAVKADGLKLVIEYILPTREELAGSNQEKKLRSVG